jgi:adenine-specific DNA-methyltransferase
MSNLVENQVELKAFLRKPYERKGWISAFSDIFSDIEIGSNPPALTTGWDEDLQSCSWLGKINLKDSKGRPKAIWILEIKLKEKNRIKAKVALRKGLSRLLSAGSIEAVIAFFATGNEQAGYRITFASAEWDFHEGKLHKRETPTKRFSFVLGPSESCTTASQRLFGLSQKKQLQRFDDLVDAFSVEKLNKDFFDGYIEQYKKILWDVANQNIPFFGIRKIDNVDELISDEEFKPIRDFVKRFMGRIVFLYFVQKKGWLGADPLEPLGVFKNSKNDFIRSIFEANPSTNGYSIFSKLFFEILNNDRTANNDFCEITNSKVPYLNSGLFEPEKIVKSKRSEGIEQHKKLELSSAVVGSYLDFLDQFNFTIDENSPNEGDVGIDPEMLGHIFENLLEDNKDRGTYYTPKIIVEYMCREILLTYLVEKIEATTEEIEEIYSFVYSTPSIRKISSNVLAKKLHKALIDVRICDPAVGSGAFPIGILHEIVWLLVDLGDRRDHSDIKRAIIAHSLRGVDFDGNAIEIARLRFWLTLIVDSSIPEPLPNLDFTLIQGNSLVGIDGEAEKVIASRATKGTNKLDQFSLSFDSPQPEADSVSSILNEFYDAHGYKKIKLLSKILEKEQDYLKTLRDEAKKLIASHKKRSADNFVDDHRIENIEKNLSTLETDSGERGYFLWHWYFGDILDEGGFDLIISNPPYVGEKGHKDLFDPIKESTLGKRFYQGKMDLFYYFMHLSLDLLKDRGIATFITTNYFITATGAKNLRKDLKERSTILRLLNFGGLKIFKSALGQHNMISVFQKGKHERKAKTLITNRQGELSPELLTNIVSGIDDETQYFQLDQDDLITGDNIKLTVGELDEVLDKVFSVSLPLELYADCHKGITTGRDSIYVLESSYVNSEAKKGDEKYLKDWYKNSDIKKYQVSPTTDKKVIYLTKFDTDLSGTHFIKNYLSLHEAEIKARKDANLKGNFEKGYWWVLATPRMEIDFDAEKIVVPQRSRSNTFGYSDCAFYGSGDIYYIIPKSHTYSVKALLGILNSKLIYVWLSQRGKRKGEMLELYQEPLSQIPIPKLDQANSKLISKIEDLVESIIKAKKADEHAGIEDLERKIDLLVYELYSLSAKQIELIQTYS